MFYLHDSKKDETSLSLSIDFTNGRFFSIDVSDTFIKISKAKYAVAIGKISREDVRLLPDLVSFMQMAPVSPGKEVCF